MIKVIGFGEGGSIEAPCGSLVSLGNGLTVIVIGANDQRVSSACVTAAKAIVDAEHEVTLDKFMGVDKTPDSNPMHAFGQGRGD